MNAENQQLEKPNRYTRFGTMLGVVTGLACVIIVVISGGGGHGSYAPAKILFPYSMFLATALTGRISPIFITVAVLQFPLYGFLIGSAAARGKVKVMLLSILILHFIALALSLSIKGDF